MQRKRFVTDKCCYSVEQLIDGSPYLPVSVDTQVISLRSQDFLLRLKTIVDLCIRDELKEERCGLFAGAGFPGQLFLQLNDGINQRLPEFFQRLHFFFFAVFFRNMEWFQPS